MFDVMIVGAGIVGSFLAHDLSKYEIKVGVIEKNSDVANGATMVIVPLFIRDMIRKKEL